MLTISEITGDVHVVAECSVFKVTDIVGDIHRKFERNTQKLEFAMFMRSQEILIMQGSACTHVCTR